MADEVRINIGDVNAKLAAMETAVQGRALEAAVRAGLLPVETLAKAIVAKVTGNLARSIHIETQASGQTASGRVGTNVEYARVQELRPGKAYMRPAFDHGRDEAINETREALKIVVRASAQ